MKIKKSLVEIIGKYIKNDFIPFYIYDSKTIVSQCRTFNEFPCKNKSIHFALMANANNDFLKIIMNNNLGVFVNSLPHLDSVLKLGFKNNKIVFTASALSQQALSIIKKSSVQLYLDSPQQLKLWRQHFPNTPVGVRCNIGDTANPVKTHAGFFIGSNSRIGFNLDEIHKLESKELINGLHLYAGTDIFDLNYLINCYKQLSEISNSFPELENINFGGGFGVSENDGNTFDLVDYGKRVSDLMSTVVKKRGNNLKMILEPGRIIGGKAGYFVCQITDIKERDKHTLVGVNASSVQFPRPLFYPKTARHPVSIIRDGILFNSSEVQNTSIYGCSTYSRDYLIKNVNLPPLEIGDIVVFGNAGSYSASAYTTFLGFPKPEEYFV